MATKAEQKLEQRIAALEVAVLKIDDTLIEDEFIESDSVLSGEDFLFHTTGAGSHPLGLASPYRLEDTQTQVYVTRPVSEVAYRLAGEDDFRPHITMPDATFERYFEMPETVLEFGFRVGDSYFLVQLPDYILQAHAAAIQVALDHAEEKAAQAAQEGQAAQANTVQAEAAGATEASQGNQEDQPETQG